MPGTPEANPESSKGIDVDLHLALFELCDEKPYHQVSVAEVIDRACCSRSTFYRHFASLDALRDNGIASVTPRRLLQQLKAKNLPLDEACHEFAEFYEARRALIGRIVQSEFADDFERAQQDIFKTYFVDKVVDSLGLNAKQNGYLVAYLGHSKAYMIRLWAERGFEIPLEQLNLLYLSVVEEQLCIEFAHSNDESDNAFLRRVHNNKQWFEYPWYHFGENDAGNNRAAPAVPVTPEKTPPLDE